MLSTIFAIYVYFLAIAFVLWLASKPKQGTDTTVETNKKLNFSEEVKPLEGTVKKSNLANVRPIAPFCHIWAKPLTGIQESLAV